MTLPAELIARARDQDLREVAEQLGAKLKRSGAEFVGPCPRCGGRDRFAVNPRRGLWNCRGCGCGGDVVSLVQRLTGRSFAESARWLDRGGSTAPAAAVKPRQAPVSAASGDNGLGFARTVWRASLPLGDGPRAYLAGRKIAIDAAPGLGGLRWSPLCPWGDGGATASCIIARFTDAITGQHGGIWRRRIDVKEPPRSLGPMRGCVIRLWPDEEVAEGLVIGEGVETVLAAATRIRHRGTLLQPAWACGGTGNLAAFPVLAGIEALTIVVDNDKNLAGQTAADACARRWLEAGREVIRLTPRLVGDFNEIVVREGGA